jgi:hypothetical protein
MSNNIFPDGILNSVVVLKIAVPGEASTQHRGVVSHISDKTITIIQGGENNSTISTCYSLDYVVLAQWATAAPVVESEESK